MKRAVFALYVLLFFLGWLMGQAGYTRALFTDAATSTGNTFTTAPSFADPTPPTVVSTSPTNTQTGVSASATITVQFSETMNTASVEGAFFLLSSGGQTACTFSWSTTSFADDTVICTPASLIAGRVYTVSIGTGAKDSVGNSLVSAYSFTFGVADPTDTTPPLSPVVERPSAALATIDTTYIISGTAEANALAKIYTDSNNDGSTAGETVVASQQLNGGALNFAMQVNLALGSNNFLVTATDATGNESNVDPTSPYQPADVPTIARLAAANYTTAGIVSARQVESQGGNAVTVTAPYSDDLNFNNTLRVEYKLSATPTYTFWADLSHANSPYSSTITGLGNASYDIQVTYLDGDGVNGNNVQVLTIDLTGSAPGGQQLQNISVSPNPFAPRALQKTTITFTLSAQNHLLLRIANLGGATVKTPLDCVDSDGLPGATYPKFLNQDWDGTDTGGTPQDGGTYRYELARFESNNCGSNAKEIVSGNILVSNPASIQMSPLPSTVTLNPGDIQTITATVYNDFNGTVAGSGGSNGGRVTFSTSAGILSVTPANCNTAPPANTTCTDVNGQATATLTIPGGNKTPQIITVTASATGDGGTSVSGTTTINDPPPEPPEELTLSLGSLKLKWKPSPSPNTAGYMVFIGRQSGIRDRVTARKPAAEARAIVAGTSDLVVDVGNVTEYVYNEVVPGTTYYVAVAGYSVGRVLGEPSREASITVPMATPTPTATPTATPTPVPPLYGPYYSPYTDPGPYEVYGASAHSSPLLAELAAARKEMPVTQVSLVLTVLGLLALALLFLL